MSWTTANSYQFSHNFAKDDFDNHKIHVPDVSSMPNVPVFEDKQRCLLLSLAVRDNFLNPIGQVMMLRVSEDGSYRRAAYGVTIEIISGDQMDSVTISNGRVPEEDWPMFAKLFQGRQVFLNRNVKIKVVFNGWSSKASYLRTIHDDLLKFVSVGDRVTLIGNDGNEIVSKRLLQARSPAMFTRDMKKLQINVSVLTLKAFIHFLRTDRILFSKKTVIELYMIGHKYNLKSLESETYKLILAHINEIDLKEAYKIVFMNDPALIEKSFLKHYAPNLLENSSVSETT